jgi:hypothetical protein
MGQYLELAGPDFFNAQITIGNQMGWKRGDSPKIFGLVCAHHHEEMRHTKT